MRLLAEKFGVNRSTVSRVIEKPLLVPFVQIHRSVMIAAGQISTRELIEVNYQEWSRQLLIELDLARQQQLVNLIKSVAPMLESGEALREGRRSNNRSCAEQHDDDELRIARALAALHGSRDGGKAADAPDESAE